MIVIVLQQKTATTLIDWHKIEQVVYFIDNLWENKAGGMLVTLLAVKMEENGVNFNIQEKLIDVINSVFI